MLVYAHNGFKQYDRHNPNNKSLKFPTSSKVFREEVHELPEKALKKRSKTLRDTSVFLRFRPPFQFRCQGDMFSDK
jgi:hypothetical protein